MGKRTEPFKPDPITMLAVYTPGTRGRSTRCVGHVVSRGKTGFESFDRDDKSLGFFPTRNPRPMPSARQRRRRRDERRPRTPGKSPRQPAVRLHLQRSESTSRRCRSLLMGGSRRSSSAT